MDNPETEAPLGPFGDGRDDRGRFIAGNRGGPGNPHARQVAALRAGLLQAAKVEDAQKVLRKLLELALGGNVLACREFLDRTCGRVQPTDADESPGSFVVNLIRGHFDEPTGS